MTCPRCSAKRCQWWETNPECPILEPLLLVTTLLKSVVSSLYKEKKMTQKSSNLSQIGCMMKEGFQLSYCNSNLTPKPTCLAIPHLD